MYTFYCHWLLLWNEYNKKIPYMQLLVASFSLTGEKKLKTKFCFQVLWNESGITE